mgnify:FL=1
MSFSFTSLSSDTIFSEQLEAATGQIDYTLLNDYMFHIVLQNNEPVLRGLVSSLLHLPPAEILSIQIMNPILPGEAISNKEFVLDIQIFLNNNTYLNLELQVENEGNWPDRSLSYLCRSFDQLYRGQTYETALPTIHIGILDYDLFPESPAFYTKNMIMNTITHKVFNDKFILSVLCLTQRNLATEEDRLWQIDTWAELFKAKTWEDIKMIAQTNHTLTNAAESLFQYNGDDMIRQRCLAREDYERHERTVNKKIQDLTQSLTESKQRIAELEAELRSHNIQP